MRNSVFSVMKCFSNSKSVNWYAFYIFRNWRLRYWINKSSWIQVKGDVCFRQSCKWEFQCNFFSYLWAMEFYRIKCLVNHGKELTNTCVLSSKKIKIWKSFRACSSKGRNGIPGRNISSWGRKSDLKICPEAETIHPKMTIRPLDEQALKVWFWVNL